MYIQTHSVLLLPRELTGCLEIDAEIGEFSFVILADVLDRVDMERNGETVNG